MYDGKKDKIIADDVYSYLPIDEKHIALLIDYSMKSYRGDLQYYLGKKKLKSIDEDVRLYFWRKRDLLKKFIRIKFTREFRNQGV